MLPLELEPAIEAVDPQDVDRTVAHDAVGDVYPVGGRGVAGLGHVHCCIFLISALRHNRPGGGL